MLTEKESAELDQLRAKYDPKPTPVVAAPESLLSYTGKTFANLPGRMFNETINTAQGLLDVDPQYRNPVPDAMQQAAPQGFGQHAVALGGGLLSMLPAFAVPELAATRLGEAAGLATNTARVIGQGAGFAAPFVDQGAGQMAGQGAIGASQAAVRSAPWPLKIAAAVGGAAGGYALAHDPEEGKMAATFNAAIPLVVDPLLGKLFGHGVKQQAPKTPVDSTPVPTQAQTRTQGIGGGEMQIAPFPPMEGQPAINGFAPLQTTGGGQPIVGQVFEHKTTPPSGYRPDRREAHIPQGGLMEIGATQAPALPNEAPYGSLIDRGFPPETPVRLHESGPQVLPSVEAPDGALMQTPFTGQMDRPVNPLRSGLIDQNVMPPGSLQREFTPSMEKNPIRTGGTQIPTDLFPSAPSVHLGELQPRPELIFTGAEPSGLPIVSEREGFTGSKRSAEPEVVTLQKAAAEANTKYDGPDPLTGQHQFTLQDVGNETTYYVRPEEMTPEGIKLAAERKRAEMQGKGAKMSDDDAMAMVDRLLAEEAAKKAAPTPSVVDTAAEKLPKTVQKILADSKAWTEGASAMSTAADGPLALREQIKPSHKAGIKKAIKVLDAEITRLGENLTEEGLSEYQKLSMKRQFLNELIDDKLAVPKSEAVEPSQAKPAGELATVQVYDPKSGEWEHASVLGKEDGVIHVEIDDPIFGKRQQYLNEKSSDVRPVEEMRASIDSGPGPTGKAIKGAGKLTLGIDEALAKLPKEAGDILRGVIDSFTKATGQRIDLHFSPEMKGAKGGAYFASGRIGINLRWVNDVVSHWASMSEKTRANAVMKFTKVLGHEITHIVQMYGERSGLQINSKPLITAIVDDVFAMSLDQRKYIQNQIAKNAGETSRVISQYLSGDVDYVKNYYEKKFGRSISNHEAMQLAAGEFMAEIGSIELAKRANLAGLPEPIRNAVNLFKGVIQRVVAWLKGSGEDFASLQKLSDIANKMLDHFAGSTEQALGHAFPSSNIYGHTAIPHPFSSGAHVPPPKVAVTTRTAEFLKEDLIRLGVRSATGAAIGGLAGPSISDHQMTVGEGILLGGVMGLAGPAVAKKLLTTNIIGEVVNAAKVVKGNPLQIFRAMMQGKTGEQLAIMAASNPKTAPSIAKFMRWLEKEFNVNMDPITRGVIEHGKGVVQEQVAIMGEAFDKARRYTPNAALSDATLAYYEGKISKTEFLNHLKSEEEVAYGNFVTVAREAMSTLSEMFGKGLPEGAFKKHVLNATDSYLGKFYSAFKEGKFNEAAFIKVRDDLKRIYNYTDEYAENVLREHQAEILANRSMFSVKTRTGGSEQAIESKSLHRRLATEDEVEAQMAIVAGLEHDQHSAAYQAERAKLDWMQKHTITDNYRDWLGEYKNPNERMMMSFMKLLPSATSSKIISLFDRGDIFTPEGLNYAYSEKELVALQNSLSHRLARPNQHTPEALASMQRQKEVLDSYMPLDRNTAYGSLAGKAVHRLLRDELSTYDNGFKWMDQPILRGIAGFNNMVKISRTALNPLTMIRNYFQLPVFSLISQVKMADIGKAWNVLKHDIDPELKSILYRYHIVGADFATQELSKGPGTYFSGYFDSDVAQRAARSGLDTMMKTYQVPDTLHRAATFLSARDRFATKFIEANPGVAMADALLTPSVLDKARNFTERYTMNYSAVPRIVKAARQLPFVSLFISYTSEITKILYNLTEDIIKPNADYASRLHAMTVLGAMTAVPAMLTAAAENALSEKDLKDWKALEKLSPEYLRSRFRIPTGRDKDGRFRFIDMTNLLPADNYSQMVKAALKGDVKAAMSANPIVSLQDTPLLNIASEQVTGRNRMTGQLLEGVADRSAAVLKEILPPIIPPGYEGQRIGRAFSATEEGGMGLTNLKTGVQTKPSDIVLNYMTSMRFGNVMLEPVKKQAIAAAKEKIATMQVSARRVLNTDAPREEKLLAAQHLQDVTKEILKELAVQLQ